MRKTPHCQPVESTSDDVSRPEVHYEHGFKSVMQHVGKPSFLLNNIVRHNPRKELDLQ